MGMLGSVGYGLASFTKSPNTSKTHLVGSVPCAAMVNFVLKQHAVSYFFFLIITQKQFLFNFVNFCFDAQIYEAQKVATGR